MLPHQQQSLPHHLGLLQPPRLLGIRTIGVSRTMMGATAGKVLMRDRAKNRRPTQRGRHLTTEAIHAIQALKRAAFAGAGDGGGVEQVRRTVEAKIRRLVKWDMMAVLRELIHQQQPQLALQVFEEVRKEHWYKAQLSLYTDMIQMLAGNGLNEEVGMVCSYLMTEHLGPDIEGFNLLLRTLLEHGFVQTTMDCFRLMKLWETEPDESTYRILILGLESKGEMDACSDIRKEAQRYFGEQLDFLEEKEEREFCNM